MRSSRLGLDPGAFAPLRAGGWGPARVGPPGHRSIATTARYLDHIAPWAVVEAMRGRAWSGQARMLAGPKGEGP